VSALGHHLEEAGIATVAIALIRPQAERTRPPRALWVPFELGRPIGPPSQPAFQRAVILAALRLLTARKTTSLIADFPEDDPREQPDPDWRPPIRPARSHGPDAMEAELRALAPAYARSCTERGRSTVGLTGLAPAQSGAYLGACLRGEAPSSPVPGMSDVLALRFASDDLKAFALEAAIAGGKKPSSRQLGDWLWNQTALGAALDEARRWLMTHGGDRGKAVAPFFVPALRLPTG